ncbi:MAG: sugar ABC transporter permease [bacterium]|nr:sugar ABC transporter permease [bacterium]
MGRKYTKYILIAPAFLLLTGTALYPFVYALMTSFRYWRLSKSPKPGPFIGFENYLRAFEDANFWNSVVVTVKFTILSVSLSLLVGIGIALLLRKSTLTNNLLKSLLIFPYAMSPALKGFSWRFMLNPHYGIIDKIIDTVCPPLANVVWLGEPATALFWLAITEVWGWAPFIALVFIGALDSMDQRVFEAARVDGATPRQVFWLITLPMLRPILVMITLLRTIFSVKMFDQVVTLTGGGPGRATETMNYYIYRQGFTFYDMGYASALAYMLIVALFLFAFFYVVAVMKGD